jgi:excisionase family DNA binding protein
MERYTEPQTDTNALLDYTAAAERMQVTERMVRKLVETRQLASVKVGRLVRLEPSAIQSYIDCHRREATR